MFSIKNFLYLVLQNFDSANILGFSRFVYDLYVCTIYVPYMYVSILHSIILMRNSLCLSTFGFLRFISYCKIINKFYIVEFVSKNLSGL